MRNVVLLGDVREKLKEIPDGVVQTCVTSPPYFGLRDYGHEGQIGLEQTPDAFVAELVGVFREVRRVLRDDGTLWLNLGDSYCSTAPGVKTKALSLRGYSQEGAEARATIAPKTPPGLKPKDLIGIPWRVAFALQADGWYLRSDIIWAKGSVMPESVTDRPTKSHEYIFLLTKNERYFYDHEAVKEPCLHPNAVASWTSEARKARAFVLGRAPVGNEANGAKYYGAEKRNRRSVWHINPKPYKGAHFATFPEELPEVCIRAGTSEKGACPKCGAPWKRVEAKPEIDIGYGRDQDLTASSARRADGSRLTSGTGHRTVNGVVPSYIPAQTNTLGWEPTCKCPEHKPVPCVVLDPFSGSGTTLAVAKYLRRDYLGCELNPEYHTLISERLRPAVDLEQERGGFDAAMELEQE